MLYKTPRMTIFACEQEDLVVTSLQIVGPGQPEGSGSFKDYFESEASGND